MKLSFAAAALVAIPTVSAYGGLGHVTIASIASHLVSNETETYFKSLLRNPGDDYLSSVATWADSYKYTRSGRFSRNFHFIDAKDSPPSYCGVDFARDCKKPDRGGCVVSAIANYTNRLLAPDRFAGWDRAMAAKFIVHFLGDIHQPLHVEDIARGGNGIHVLWHKKHWNLHHIWDSTIAEEMNGGYHRNPYPTAHRWGATLADEIRRGKFVDLRDKWLDGMNISDPIESSMSWARESNSYVCSHVMPEGPEAIAGQELSGAYYEAAAPVLESLVASAGFRLAKWLDLITEAIMLKPGGQESSFWDEEEQASFWEEEEQISSWEEEEQISSWEEEEQISFWEDNITKEQVEIEL